MVAMSEQNVPDPAAPASGPAPDASPAEARAPGTDAPVVRETLAEKLGTAEPARPAEPVNPGITREAPLLLQFVVFPLVIVVIAVAITGFFTWLAQDRRSYDEYLTEISTGWKRKRPEAAYQLQFRLADSADDMRKQADVTKTVAVFVAAKKDRDEDPGVRRYLAIVLGHLADKAAVPALMDAAAGDEPDQETRLNATWALGRCRDARAVPVLVGLLDDAFEGQRKTACFALGDVGDPVARDPLAKRLSDDKIDVRWNAACALARLGDARALPTLLSMLDRRLLDSVTGTRDGAHTPMTDKQREDVMVNALRGVLALKAVSALERVSAVADGDPSLTVRQAALQVRDVLKGLPAETR